MSVAVISVRSMLQPSNPSFQDGKPTNAKFEDKSGKRWNYRWQGEGANLAPHFAPDKRLRIDYNESPFTMNDGKQVVMKWINAAQLATDSDSDTWPEKAPYQGGNGNGNGGGNGGGGSKGGDYRSSEEIILSDSLHMALAYLTLTKCEQAEYQDVVDTAMLFKQTIRPSIEKLVETVAEALGGIPMGDDDDGIPF